MDTRAEGTNNALPNSDQTEEGSISAFLDRLVVPALLIGGDGSVHYANDAISRMTGRHRQALVGEHWSAAMSVGDRQRLRADPLRTSEYGCSVLRTNVQNADGRGIPADIALIRLTDGSYLSVVIDPEAGDERSELDEAWKSAFALMPFPSLLIGESSEIQDANDALATLLGVPVPQLVGGSLADIVASDSREGVQETVSRVLAHGFRYGACGLLRRDGYQVPVHWIGVRLQSRRLLFTVRDVEGWRDALVNLSVADPSTDPAGAPWVKGEDIVEVGDLTIDLAHRNVVVRGNPIVLTPREFAVLEILARNRGKVVFSDHLVTRVWGEADRPNLALVRTVVSRLREKLEADSSHPQYIETVPGAGYLLKGSD